MSGTYHTATFDNIPAEKRERILGAAVLVLGRDGISGARMADVAAAAGISHGSIFSYFPTKDDLVRAVVAHGIRIQAERFSVPRPGLEPGAGDGESRPFADLIASVYGSAWELASAEPELISLWMSLSLIENQRFSADILPLESDGASRWGAIVESGVAEGAIDPALDRAAVVYLLDALAAQLMKSRASELEREKLRLVLGGAGGDAPEAMARFACSLLRPRAQAGTTRR